MNKAAEKLFGKVTGKIYRATGNNKADKGKLCQPLEGPDSVAHIFCKGCGTYLEANSKQAERYLQKSGAALPENFSDYYFEVAGCDVCDGDRDIIILKKIK